jgi:hypothetical protein
VLTPGLGFVLAEATESFAQPRPKVRVGCSLLVHASLSLTLTWLLAAGHIFGQANAEEFIHVFVGQEEWLAKFLEFIVQQGLATNLVYNTLLEIYLRDDVRDTLHYAHHRTRTTHD